MNELISGGLVILQYKGCDCVIHEVPQVNEWTDEKCTVLYVEIAEAPGT